LGLEDGRTAGRVADVLFSAQGDRVIGLLLQGGTWWRRRLIPYEEVAAVGPAAVMLRRPVVLATPDGPRLRRLRRPHAAVLGCRVLTRDGRDLGIVEDVCFEPETGRVVGLLVSRGLLGDLSEGKVLLPVVQVRRGGGGRADGVLVADPGAPGRSSGGEDGPPDFLLTPPV
jgi:uncharacterized protein YrrD